MAVADQIPRFANALDADRTTQTQGLLFGKPLSVEIDDTNALAVTLTSTTFDAGAGTSAAHDWYKHGHIRIIPGSPAPTAASTITITQASGGGDPEPAGRRSIENTLEYPVTITGAAQGTDDVAPVIPAGGTRSILITATSVLPDEAARMNSYTVATVPTGAAAVAGAGPIFVSNGAAGAPVMAFHDGTNWVRCDTLVAIAAA